MGEPTLRIRLTVDTADRDTLEQDQATRELRGEIQRIAPDRTSLVVEPAASHDPESTRKGAVDVITVDVLTTIATGLFSVVSAYLASHQHVYIHMSTRDADGQEIAAGPADKTMSDTMEHIAAGPRAPTRPATQDPDSPSARTP